MSEQVALLDYVTRLGDNALLTGQRMIERVTLEPELELELANANFALDYIGQARLYYAYAAELQGDGNDEDHFAYHRDAQEFRNFLMTEQPNGNFADALVRQFLFESFYLLQLESLAACSDQRLAEIAQRAVKEVRYHLRHAKQWLIRLGNGTEESHNKVVAALDGLWRYVGEFFDGDAVDQVMQQQFNGPDLAAIQATWFDDVSVAFQEASLSRPDVAFFTGNGRSGAHTEHLGFLLAEMQHLQRAYPGANW